MPVAIIADPGNAVAAGFDFGREKEKTLPALKTGVFEKAGAIKNSWNISQRTNLFM